MNEGWIAALAALAAAAIAALGFWMRLSDRITKASQVGENALQEAAEVKEEMQRRGAEAKRENDELRLSIAALDRAFSMYQVAIAKEAKDIVSRGDLREMETRITASIESLGKGFHGRIDNVVKDVASLSAEQRRAAKSHQ